MSKSEVTEDSQQRGAYKVLSSDWSRKRPGGSAVMLLTTIDLHREA